MKTKRLTVPALLLGVCLVSTTYCQTIVSPALPRTKAGNVENDELQPDRGLPNPWQGLATAEDVGMDGAYLDRIDDLVEAEIAAQNIPGCVVLITRHGRTAFHRAYGRRQLQPDPLPMQLDTVFDLASLTKPIATATSIMKLIEGGEIQLDDRYGQHVEAFNQNDKQDVTILQMLTHQAGLIPDNSLTDYAEKVRIWPHLWSLGLRYAPGTDFVYSDVGFQMLGRLVEIKSGQSLDTFTRENIFLPLGMLETEYLPPQELQQRSATTEQRNGQWLQGEVHDPRAFAMGGVAGHAGLFSTATDLARYAQMILNGGVLEGTRVLQQTTVEQMLTGYNVDGNLRALGWDVDSGFSTNRGNKLSKQAIGHGGFTGTSIWIDPGLDMAIIFLSNRVHPDGSGQCNRLAGAIADVAAASIVVASALKAEPTADDAGQGRQQPVLTGIDVLSANDFQTLGGRSIGLITNHTGTARDGRRTIELLKHAEGVNLVAIFSPEHGLAGRADQPHIADAVDEATGLPVFSLYGENREPTQASLANIDTLVFDIQDIGARFYTYNSTMLAAMRAAAKYKKRFVVLDRPNPLGGMQVAGPLLDAGRQSFVGCHTLPVQHGMTSGELAQMFASELNLDLELSVVKMQNWQRSMRWDETGLSWIDPSPNMRHLNAALLYPGIGLLEMTNLSVGRGTDRPFEIIGAPYIDHLEFAQRLNQSGLPGLRFIPRRFVPTASKFVDESCGGVDIVIVNRDQVRGVETGLTVAAILREMYPEQWQYQAVDRLLCNARTMAAIESGDFATITELDESKLKGFLDRREKFLLYNP